MLVSIASTDTGCGVSETDYTLDGSQHAYVAPFTVSGDGSHKVTAWATDGAGNKSAVASATYTIDTTAPSVSIAPSSATTFTASFSATLTATDAGCGVAEIDYTLDGMHHVYTAPFAIAGEGTLLADREPTDRPATPSHR